MTTTHGDAKSLDRMLSSSRIPVHSTLVLTNRCNLSCKHCYRRSSSKSIEQELDLDGWKQILVELQNQGCIRLKLTGGEPLIHKDFIDIYRTAYDMGFYVELATNGIVMNDKIIETLTNRTPDRIIISIYGCSDETYRDFCGHDHGYSILSKNLKRMINNRLHPHLQTVLNKYNVHELKRMKTFADELGCDLHCYRSIHCDTSGTSVLDLAVDEEQFMDSISVMGDRNGMISSMKKSKGLWTEDYKMCSAGVNACNIDPYGNMFLCNMCTEHSTSVLEHGFAEAWGRMLEFRENEITHACGCSSCECRTLCGMCSPAYRKESQSILFRTMCDRNKRIYRRLNQDG